MTVLKAVFPPTRDFTLRPSVLNFTIFLVYEPKKIKKSKDMKERDQNI